LTLVRCIPKPGAQGILASVFVDFDSLTASASTRSTNLLGIRAFTAIEFDLGNCRPDEFDFEPNSNGHVGVAANFSLVIFILDMSDTVLALKPFGRVGRLGSFSRAGRECSHSQRSVSRIILGLERKVRAALLTRTIIPCCGLGAIGYLDTMCAKLRGQPFRTKS
jgi:hypothetical protein